MGTAGDPKTAGVYTFSVFSGCKAVFSPSTTHFHKFKYRIVGNPEFQGISVGSGLVLRGTSHLALLEQNRYLERGYILAALWYPKWCNSVYCVLPRSANALGDPRSQLQRYKAQVPGCPWWGGVPGVPQEGRRVERTNMGFRDGGHYVGVGSVARS